MLICPSKCNDFICIHFTKEHTHIFVCSFVRQAYLLIACWIWNHFWIIYLRISPNHLLATYSTSNRWCCSSHVLHLAFPFQVFSIYIIVLCSSEQLLHKAPCEDFDPPSMVFARVGFCLWRAITSCFEGC